MRSPLTFLVSLLSVKSTETLSPTTERVAGECPKFRILVAGPSESGKSSLIDAIFETSLRDVIHGQSGTDVNREIASQYNERLAIHYSHDFDPESVEKFSMLKKFIVRWSQNKPVAERLHAIWICIASPSSDGPSVALDRRIFKLNRKKVPVIIIFTKFDLFVQALGNEGSQNGKISREMAEREFRKRYSQIFEASTKGTVSQTPYTLVALSQPETLQRLVDITMNGMDIEVPLSLFARIRSSFFTGPSKRNRRASSGKDVSYLAKIALAAAQRVDTRTKVTASIQVGKKAWNAIASNERFFEIALENCFSAIHKDIVAIWNIWDLNEFLLGEAFRCRVMSTVENFIYQSRINSGAMQRDVTTTSKVGSVWMKDVFQGRPEQIQCLMGYLVNLILILQAVFQLSLEDRGRGAVTPDGVIEIIYEFVCSGRGESINNAIAAFVGDRQPPASDSMMDKIESLIKENKIRNDTRLIGTQPPLPSLLAILRVESITRNVINRTTLDFMSKLLDSPNLLAIVSDVETTSDVELLLDFTFSLLRNGSLKNRGVQDANRKARCLADALSKKGVLPRSLLISHIEADHRVISAGDFGSVFKGEYNGQTVAMKMLYEAPNNEDSLRKDICREALSWWSLLHDFILPLSGIYEMNTRLFLISPHMEIGTLFEWRKNHWPGVVDIRGMILEVAQGLEYIHSEGVVHGDLSTMNVLLDSELHCRITDFGLTRHVESTVSPSVAAISINYAAPELVRTCTCHRSECNKCAGQRKRKTMATDVYAFGCVYYAAFFGTIPFEGQAPHLITYWIAKGQRPSRLDSPKMDDETWNLVTNCWLHEPSERPTMSEIVARLMARPESPLTFLITKLRASGGSMDKERSLDFMRSLLDISEFDSVASQVRTGSDAELLLDLILHVLRNHSLANLGIEDANQKARKLMFRLISITNVIPKSLFMTDIEAEPNLGLIGIGGFGHVFRGECKGQRVMLKMVEKGRNDGLISEDSRRQALLWRSLSHRLILPLLGAFKQKSQLFLVSPFMENGTLDQWRRQHRDVAEINKLILEVAEGIHYLHSEGVVHGNLNGSNILLDSQWHCQITGFGSARHTEATVTQSAQPLSFSFAAPELFGLGEQHSKTTKSDVYAFGCLYYAMYFNIVPFHDFSDLQIAYFVTRGERPVRLDSPSMRDNTWDLIQSCWETNPSIRPTIEQILDALAPSA